MLSTGVYWRQNIVNPLDSIVRTKFDEVVCLHADNVREQVTP